MSCFPGFPPPRWFTAVGGRERENPFLLCNVYTTCQLHSHSISAEVNVQLKFRSRASTGAMCCSVGFVPGFCAVKTPSYRSCCTCVILKKRHVTVATPHSHTHQLTYDTKPQHPVTDLNAVSLSQQPNLTTSQLQNILHQLPNTMFLAIDTTAETSIQRQKMRPFPISASHLAP